MDSKFSSFLITLFNVRPTVARGDSVQAGTKVRIIKIPTTFLFHSHAHAHIARSPFCCYHHKIGTVSSSECGANSFHLSMKKVPSIEGTTKTAEFVDPTQKLPLKNKPSGAWVQECDDYRIVFKNKVIASGSITKGRSTPEQIALQRKVHHCFMNCIFFW